MNPQRSNRWLTALAVAGVALIAAAITTPAARAQTFSTPGGSVDFAGDPVSASATFVVKDGEIDITLINLQTNMKDAGQLLTDLKFSLSGNALTGTVLHTSSGNEIFVGTGGVVTAGSTGVSTGWGYATGSGYLDGLAGANTPKDLILGPPDASGKYSSANGSIANNPGHNPFLDQAGATFAITGTNITSSTIVSNVVFSFGTSRGDDIGAVPEPSTLAIAGLGAIGFMGFGLRRRLKK
jgi:hypothetical protein